MKPSGPRSRRSARLQGVAVALASTCAIAGCFALAEGALRWKRGAPPAEFTSRFDYAYFALGRPFFKAEKLPSGLVLYKSQRMGALPRSFVMPKPEGLLRIFVVGGSVAIDYGGPNDKLAGLIRRTTGRDVEVIGCGMGAYDSRRELAIVREIIAYQPDLIVVFSGNNEYYNDIPYPRLAYLDARLSRAWLYRDLRSALQSGPPRQLPLPTRLRRFEDNLRAMVREARGNGVAVVLTALPANLKDSAPTSDGGAMPMNDRRLLEGWEAWENGRLQEASSLLREYSRLHPGDPYSRFYLAKILERQGRTDEAGRQYAAASDLDNPGEKSSPMRAEIVRRVAKEEGAAAADFEGTLRGLAAMRAPGFDFFKDACHWRQEYYPLANLTVLRAIDGLGLWNSRAWDWSWLDKEEPGIRRPYIDPRLTEDMMRLMLYSAVTKAVVSDDRGLSEEAILQFQSGLERAPALFEEITGSTAAVAEKFHEPWHPTQGRADPVQIRCKTLTHLGAVFRRRGLLVRSLTSFDEALRLNPKDYQPALGRALTLRRLGRLKEAETQLEKLLAAGPAKSGEARQWLDYWRSRPR